MRQYNTIGKRTKQELQEIASRVFSIAGFLKEVGLNHTRGSNYETAKKYLHLHAICTDHWTGQGWSKGRQTKDWSSYRKNTHLRKNLLTLRGHMCENCKNTDWQGKPITIEIHHIDGNRTHNSLENLKLLCPNCHSLTDNFRNKKRK